METYCVICEKYTANENSSVRKKLHNFNSISNDWFKMNKIINKFLLTGDKFMPKSAFRTARVCL